MRRLLSSAAVAAALSSPAACIAAEFPFSPPRPAAEAFTGAVPTMADIPLGTPYETVRSRFLDMQSEFSISSASRDLNLGNASDGTVSFGFPETLVAKTKSEEGDLKEERRAVFSSPLTGSQLLILEREFTAIGDKELSIPAFEKAVVSALGMPSGRGGSATSDIPKLVYIWVDGRLVAPTEILELEATPGATMEAIGKPDNALDALERKVDACSRIADFVRNDALIDTVNAISKGVPVPEHCSAMASVFFYTGSQTDLSRRIVVTLAYTGAIVEDAKKVRSFMSDALKSGAGRKPGVAIDGL